MLFFIVLKADNWGWKEGELLIIGWLEKIDFFSACINEKSKKGNKTEWACGKSIGFWTASSLGFTSLILLIKSENPWLAGLLI